MLCVFDGANPDAAGCGVVCRGTTAQTISRTTFADWKQEKDLYVYVEGGSVKMESSYPTQASNVFRRLLARVIYRNGAYSVVQEQFGPIAASGIEGLL